MDYVHFGNEPLFIGDSVVVDRYGELVVGSIDRLDVDDDDCIGLSTGGWFGIDGKMNIGGWKIIRKATEEDVANLSEY